MTLGIWAVGWITGNFWLNITHASGPIPSLKTIHSAESTVVEVPANVYPPEMVAFWWAVPGAAYLYFILFGANREVLSDYQKLWVWFRTRVLRQTVPVESMSATEYVFPVQILREIRYVLTASPDLPVIVCPRISRHLPSTKARS
jgi:hypothetical protein